MVCTTLYVNILIIIKYVNINNIISINTTLFTNKNLIYIKYSENKKNKFKIFYPISIIITNLNKYRSTNIKSIKFNSFLLINKLIIIKTKLMYNMSINSIYRI